MYKRILRTGSYDRVEKQLGSYNATKIMTAASAELAPYIVVFVYYVHGLWGMSPRVPMRH